MGLNFQFATATQIIFGIGVLEKAPALIGQRGKRVLVVCGSSENRVAGFTDKLARELAFELFHVPHEPTAGLVDKGISLARRSGCDVVAGIGGGSVIDTAKAIAAMVPNEGVLMDYLEVVGRGRKLTERPLPFIAIPTTAGTGSEVTKNSVIKSEEHNVKVSLRSDMMYPEIALVDPALTVSMPPELTATTGFDALTHLLESFVSCQSNSFIDMFCREGLRHISNSLEQAFLGGGNLQAREGMAMASMLGGIALANAKLGAVHGFAGPLGGMLEASHGAICASLLPAVMRTNIIELRKINEQVFLDKYRQVAQILTGNSQATADDGVRWVEGLGSLSGIPSLSALGLQNKDFKMLVDNAKVSSSMKGNPLKLDDQALISVLEKSV